MKKLIFILLFFFVLLPSVNAQKGINFHYSYSAGRKILMNVDSAAKNILYANVFPNQPHTFFNFLREVNQVNIQIYFRKTDSVQNYRYTILADNKPIVVNKTIDEARLKDDHAGTEETLRSLTFGTFAIKDKIIKIIVYDIQKPQDVYTTVLYGKPIPRAKIAAVGRRFKDERGVDYKYIVDPKEKADLILNENDDELTIVKYRSDIDYIYNISIEDKQTGKIVFNSTAWQYGDQLDSAGDFFPYVKIDKSVFKKSGDYEIIIKPMMRWTGCLTCDITAKQIEQYIARCTLAIRLEEESYTKKEVLIYTLIVAVALGLAFLVSLYFIKKRNKKKLADNEQQKNIAKLQPNSIRSQLNPHFLFNALSGIQNLMNKNEVDNAISTCLNLKMQNYMIDKIKVNLMCLVSLLLCTISLQDYCLLPNP
jgi:hypothetical protein